MLPKMRPLLLVFVLTMLAVMSVSSSIIFRPSSGTRCVSHSGHQEHCVPASRCPQLVTGASQTNCVRPCGFARGELMVCCEKRARSVPVPTTAPPRASNLRTRRPSWGIIWSSSTKTTPTPEASPRCGVAGAENSRRPVLNISAGKVSVPGRWPWLALLGVQKGDDVTRWLCGGALISARHVLTAAHCVVGTPDQLRVRLGEHDTRTDLDTEHQDMRVIRAANHPGFSAKQNDLAVLTLHEPVQLSRWVAPVCVPEGSELTETGRRATVAGWGRVEFRGETSPHLLEATVEIVDQADCEATYRSRIDFEDNFPDGGFDSSKLCAADSKAQGADACQGDSGGPLVVEAPDGAFRVVGIISEGVGCGSADFPGVYTRVASYISWIREQVADS